MHLQERPSAIQSQVQTMHIRRVIKENVESLKTERNKYVIKRDLMIKL